MRYAEAGVLRPEQSAPLSKSEDRQIQQICPGVGQSVVRGRRRDHELWGPFVDMQIGWARDPALRNQASSGGALSAVLSFLIESGRVNGVVQTHAALAPAFANEATISTNAEAIFDAAGSRYAPSAPLAGLNSALDSDKTYAFVGKPCDVAALRALGETDPRVARRFPYMISFFCAGVPALKGAEAVLDALEVDAQDLAAFRYRGQGWPGRATATLKDGGEASMTYHDSWGKILSKHVQHRCKICADGSGVAADLAFADAWESDDDGYPVFEEQDGVSLVVTRTEVGQRLLSEAIENGALATSAFDVAKLAQIQPGQRRRRRALLARLAGLKVCGRPTPRYRGLKLWSAARRAGAADTLRNFLGMIRRCLTGRPASAKG